MGSVAYNVPDGQTKKQSAVEYLERDCKVTVRHAAAKGGIVYAAVEDERRDPGRVFAVVCITSMRKNDYHNFCIKVVTESEGPADSEAPAKLLDMLSDTEGPRNGHEDWAAEWRQRCRSNIERTKKARRVKPGTVIRLPHPLEFSDKVERDTFTFEKGSRFTAADGVRVHITGWRKRPFEVVA